jgi:6-phosphogluconate dehydrogenase
MSEQIGLVGLAVMGQNLALNIAEEGFRIAVYNRSPDKVDEAVARAGREGGLPLVGYKDVGGFVQALERPRKIILLVKAGAPVDATLDSLVPHLAPGDIVIDGGNEYFVNTERRARALADKGLRFFGMGVSGGEEGARHGPSLMPGGDPEAYALLAPILTKVAAQVDDGPCVTYIGPGGAGHYVKMVHNGIEYGDMQLIAEAYDVLKNVGGLSNAELADTFTAWNEAELQSFLIELTAKVFRRADPEGAYPQLVDAILDVSGMKGTGKWTVQQAAELASAAPTIASAVEARIMSAARDERLAASKALQGPAVGALPGGARAALVDDVKSALYAAKICSYAQGMNLLRAASKVNNWGLKLGAISRIWKGGCIIRARFLDRIRGAYDRDPALASLLVDPDFAAELNARQAAWRRVVVRAVEAGIAVPGMTASLGYYDTYRRARLPANLIQAQRDFFGAHTYQRVDRDGTFHTDWE